MLLTRSQTALIHNKISKMNIKLKDIKKRTALSIMLNHGWTNGESGGRIWTNLNNKKEMSIDGTKELKRVAIKVALNLK